VFNDNITKAMKQLVSHCLDQQQNKLYYCIKIDQTLVVHYTDCWIVKMVD